MNHNNRFESKIKTVTQSQKINQIKNNIDPSIIKPNEPDKDKVKISFTDIKKEEKKKKKEIDKKENDKKKRSKYQGQGLSKVLNKIEKI